MSREHRGLGTVYLRGRVWWVVYHVRGRRLYESSRSEDRTVAVALLKRRLGEVGLGRPVGPDVQRTTFEDLATMLTDDYAANGRRSGARMETSLTHLRAAFGLDRAGDITTDRMTRYVRARLDAVAAPASIRNELAALKRAFRLAHRAGRVAAVPAFPSLAVDNVRSGFFEPEDLAALLRELPVPLRPVVRFAALTGWRKGEILGLTWAAVDFTAGTVRLEPGTTMNRQGRVFPFTALPALADLLREQRETTYAVQRARGEIIPWVFHRGGVPIRDFYVAWRSAVDRAAHEERGVVLVLVRPQLVGRILHDLRRTAVRNLERAGVSRSVAMSLTGHKTEAVYRRYAIVDSAAQREGVAKLATFTQGVR